MNENPRIKDAVGGVSSVAMGFVVGALVGAGVALLLAPGTGKENRQRLADTGRRWGAAARGRFDQARDAAMDLREDAKSALNAGRETFEHRQKSQGPRSVADTELKG